MATPVEEVEPREIEAGQRADNPKLLPPRGKNVTRLLVFLGALVAVAIASKYLWDYFSSYESTDDAQIQGHMDAIGSRINGTVTAVHFENNQFVKAGEVLVELDPRDYLVALEQARANLRLTKNELTAQRPNVPITRTTNDTGLGTARANIAEAQAALEQAQHNYNSALADLSQAEANSARAQADEARYRSLVEKDEVAKSSYDERLAEARANEALVNARRQAAEADKRVIAQRQAALLAAQLLLEQAEQNYPRAILLQQANVESRQAGIDVNKALVDQAELNLSYCKIIAPASGIAGNKNVETGEQVQPGQALVTITQTNHFWVTANFKETQIRHMHPGQKADIQVDALGDTFKGTVEGMPGATGAEYSVLPPENATGNYVKVVQRLPVRIHLDTGQRGMERLRPGMSVEPKVWIR